MYKRFDAQPQYRNPRELFLIVLLLVFVVELAIMCVMPWLPSGFGEGTKGLIDAWLLVGILSPLLWILVIRPLHSITQDRLKLLERVLTSEELERGRIARELHDGVGQLLTSLLVGLRTLEEFKDGKQVHERLEELRQIGHDAHDEVRRIARALRPSVLDNFGLVEALRRLVEETCRAHHCNFTIDLSGLEGVGLSDSYETALFRIVQEAINNAITHGKPGEIQVVSSRNREQVMISICDDGSGFDPASVLTPRSGELPFGLLSMRERAAYLSGTATITSRPGSGTQVRISLPLTRGDAK